MGNIPIYTNHKSILQNYDILFILSYHQLINKESLLKNRHNIVIHESLLPKGKGWAPLFWQVLEGKKIIPFTMFEAGEYPDDGDIYMQKNLKLDGCELNKDLREKQAKITIQMCLEFVNSYEKYKIPSKQIGDESFYAKRNKKNSELDINKTIKEQFNLLRVVNNSDYPAYFKLDGNRYILKIELDKSKKVELIDFVDLSVKEKLMILNWRNDENVQKWMYSQEDISIEDNFDFIGGLQFSTNKQYLVVKKQGMYVGVIYFTDIDFNKKQCYFGLYANLTEKSIGKGRILEKICSKYIFGLLSFQKIKLEVFSSNEKAINLYRKCNYKKIGMKSVNNNKVIFMEKIQIFNEK